MGRKSKRQLEEEAYFEANKETIYQVSRNPYGPCGNRNWKYEEDKLFAILVLVGYPAAKAYRLAYPQSKATLQSSAALASRKLHDPAIQEILRTICDSYWENCLYLNDGVCQEKSRKRPKWMLPRCNKITPD